MLCIADISRLTKSFVCCGVVYANSVMIPGGNSRSTRQPHEQRIKVGTLPSQITGLQHRLYVAPSAATDSRIAVGIVNYPVINGVGFF